MKNIFLAFLLFLTATLQCVEQLTIQLSANKSYVNCSLENVVFYVDVTNTTQLVPTGTIKLYRNECYAGTIYLDTYSNNHYSYQCDPCIQTQCFTEVQTYTAVYQGDTSFATAQSNAVEIIVDALPYATMTSYYNLGEYVFLDITSPWEINVHRRNQSENPNPIETTVTFNHEWEWHEKNNEEHITGEFFPTTYSDTDEIMEVVVKMTDTVTGRFSTSRFYFLTIPLVDSAPDEYTLDFTNLVPSGYTWYYVEDSVLNNDTGLGLVACINDYPAHGNLVLNFDGTFTYYTEPGFNGDVSFTYFTFDQFWYGSEPQTVTLHIINPVQE